jgi:solute carrier family 25 carnitine/acylcarnitine transporter 20/29
VVRRIVRSEGIRGLWRGVTPPLLAAVPQFAVVFASYDYGQHAVAKYVGWHVGDLRNTALAGALVALPTSLIYTPIVRAPLASQRPKRPTLLPSHVQRRRSPLQDRVKLTMQVEGRRISAGQPRPCASAYNVAVGLWRAEGAAALTRGFFATLARDVPAWATYFVVYSAAKRSLTSNTAALDGEEPLSLLASLTAGGLAGAATWAICMPVDVIKSAYQSNTAYRTYGDTCRAIMRASGVRGLFAGFWTIVLGGVPRDAACLTGTECMLRLLARGRERHRPSAAKQ